MMKKKQIIRLMTCLASIFIISFAFQFFSLKHVNLGKHKYNTYNSLVILNHPPVKNINFLNFALAMAVASPVTNVLLDIAEGPAALAAEAAATTITIVLRAAPIAEEKIISKSRLTKNIRLNNLD